MGLSAEEWGLLGIETKAKLAQQQAQIDEKKRQEELLRWQKQQQMELERQRAEQARLDRIYAEMRFGDIIHVNLYGGDYEYSRKFLPLVPTTFTLAKGEIKQIEVTYLNEKRSYTYETDMWICFGMMGNKLMISPQKIDSCDGHDGIIILNDGSWRHERRYHSSYLQGYQKLKNVIVGVRYAR